MMSNAEYTRSIQPISNHHREFETCQRNMFSLHISVTIFAHAYSQDFSPKYIGLVTIAHVTKEFKTISSTKIQS